MACNLEIQILEYLDGQTPPDQRAAVEAHLATCAECAALSRQWKDMDFLLSREIKAPSLSPSFDARLRQRLRTEKMLLSQAERAARKQRFEQEYSSTMSQLKNGAWLAILVDGIAVAVLVALVGWAFWGDWAGLAARYLIATNSQPLVLAGATLGLVTLAAIAVTLVKPLRQFWLLS